MNEHFGKKTDFDFEVSLVEEAIQNNNNLWNTWTGNRNSGMDAVALANFIDKTQLSNSQRKQQRKRISTVERISNLRREMEERVQLNEKGIQNDTVWLHDLSDRSSVTKRKCVLLMYQQQHVAATGLAMARLHRSRQCGLSRGLLINWKFLMIYGRLIETQMIRSWCFVVKEAR